MGAVPAIQGSLIDCASAVDLAPLDGFVERTGLTDGAWIDLRRRWVTGSDLLFERLVSTVPWRSEERWMYRRRVEVPRLVASYGEGENLPDPLLERARDVLSVHYADEPGGAFAAAGLCLYRDGSDSVAWHGDRIGRGAVEDVLVAIVSFGAERRFALRPRGGGAALRLTLARGDLLVMGGSCQRTWEHSVPKSARADGARVSVQFRPRNTG
jgi:alkylated DNA repair dioxygenase AlkB